jgi:DNA-binding GntR family transcriptional regulator
MTTLPPVEGTRRRSSGDEAARYIRWLIFEGVLRPGDRVPQDLVARTLGISRIPVREALISLEREGWVTLELHRGAFVTAISEATVRDHYELFGLILGFAARRALVRGAPDFPERLGKLADALIESDDAKEISTLSVQFHTLVLEEANNRRIGALVGGRSALVPGDFFVEVPGAVPVQKAGVAAIARAVTARQADTVARLYLDVMRAVSEEVVALFDRRHLFG